MFKPKPRTFRATMVRAALMPFVILAMGVVGYFSSVAVFGDIVTGESATVAPVVEPTKAERLSAKHDCWNGAAPADMEGKMPGKAVVTVAGETRLLRTPASVGTALDAAFGAPTEIETVHSFCR